MITGRLDVLKSIGGEQVINHYDAGEYGGEVPILLGAPAIAACVPRSRRRLPPRSGGLPGTDRSMPVAHNAELMQTMARRVSGLRSNWQSRRLRR